MQTNVIMFKNERFWNWLNKSAQGVRLQRMIALAISVAVLILFGLSYSDCTSQAFHQKQTVISLQQAGGLLFLLLLQFAVCLKVVFWQRPRVSLVIKLCCLFLTIANLFLYVVIFFTAKQGHMTSVVMFSGILAGLLVFGASVSYVAGRLDWDKLS